MTDANSTIRALAAITDAALFERLATAVLRSSDSLRYSSINHSGVNADGKTVKSPFDNFGWSSITDSAHAVAAAHSTCTLDDLRGKWLHDPSTVKSRNPTGKPTAPEGDLRKAIRGIVALRAEQPALKATLALTSNREPDHNLMSDARKLADEFDITLDIWSASRLAYHLDNTPEGQWLRRTHLGAPVELVSSVLLLSCARKTIENRAILVSKDEIIQRDGSTLASASHTLIVGPSGVGKTMVALQLLSAHLDAGGLGLVIAHETLSTASTLAEAVDTELRKLEPDLIPHAGAQALALASENSPFFVLVEDANRASDPSLILNKVLSWALAKATGGTPMHWRLVCPAWPRFIDSLDQANEVARRVHIYSLGVYSNAEAVEAIRRKAMVVGATLLPTEITSIAKALGNDPLLIGLYDFSSSPNPKRVVGDYIDREFLQAASKSSNTMCSDLLAAAGELARQMMLHRNLAPTWAQIANWFQGESTHLDALRVIVKAGTVLRLRSREGTDTLIPRHDRVLLTLLVRVVEDDLRGRRFDAPYLSDPFFAEVIGVAASEIASSSAALDDLITRNPLALHFALQAAANAAIDPQNIVSTLSKWLQDEGTHEHRFQSVRFRSLQVLAQIDADEVLPLTELFQQSDRYDAWSQARFRNGDLRAGLRLLTMYPFGATIAGRRELLQHIFARWGATMTQELSDILRQSDIDSRTYRGALYFAGYLGNPIFTSAILEHWNKTDPDQRDLEAYLWAASRCYDELAGGLLTAVCDAWSALPSSRNSGESSPRDELAAHEIAWEFRDYIPVAAIPYFVQRAQSDDQLSWPLTYMLRGVDHPTSIEHIVRYLATFDNSIGSHFFLDEWERRQQELGKRMSEETKRHLLRLALSSETEDKIRKIAFSTWGLTQAPDDVKELRTIGPEHLLYKEAIWQRARRADKSVVPELVAIIPTDPRYWWQTGRYIWSSEMLALLEQTVHELADKRANGDLRDHDVEWIISELLMELDTESAERVLLKRWDDLKASPRFFQAALYHGSSALMSLIASTIASVENPSNLFEYSMTRMGWKNPRRKGINFDLAERLARMAAFLSENDVHALWDICNERGWTPLRKQHLDSRLQKSEKFSSHVSTAVDFSSLEKALNTPQTEVSPFWIENHLGRGRTLSELIDALLDWLKTHKTIQALEIVADIFQVSANRGDLERLVEMTRSWPGTGDILTDLLFSVHRRTLQ